MQKFAVILTLITAVLLSSAFSPKRPEKKIKKSNVIAHMEFLASDAMEGRGSGTKFELLAGLYLASQMKQFGLSPAGDKDASGKTSFIQTISISRNTFSEPPVLNYSSSKGNENLTHGNEIMVLRTDSQTVAGPLQKIGLGDNAKPGSAAFVKLKEGDNPQSMAQSIGNLFGSGAALVIVEETPALRARWKRSAARPIRFSKFSKDSNISPTLLVISKTAAEKLAKVADGTKIEFSGKLEKPQVKYTWNAVGMIKGKNPKLSSQVVLLSAHMDHVGIRESASGDDKIYNGADDDASGTVAVLELARILASGKRPKRTIYFAFFGSEESGGFGSKFFVKNLAFPKEKLIANLQFEMLGRPDPKVAKGELWLTGYERSNLGSELARRGARLVQDPHPKQNFFQRSDNYTLAKEGVVAHTVSSFGLHKDYHRPSDEIETIDFDHMTNSINSMIKPVEWLVNSKFVPEWHEGKRP